jgi:hypothetical protein
VDSIALPELVHEIPIPAGYAPQTVTHKPTGELRWPMCVVRAFKVWSQTEGRYVFPPRMATIGKHPLNTAGLASPACLSVTLSSARACSMS